MKNKLQPEEVSERRALESKRMLHKQKAKQQQELTQKSSEIGEGALCPEPQEKSQLKDTGTRSLFSPN